jgi:hypothetical protein
MMKKLIYFGKEPSIFLFLLPGVNLTGTFNSLFNPDEKEGAGL